MREAVAGRALKLRPLAVLVLALMLAVIGDARADDAGPVRLPFELTAPVEFRGEWSIPAAPFLHPSFTRNWVRVRVEKFDAQTGSVSGRFDVYIRSICDDIVDEPFKGTFDGTVLRFQFEYWHCPLMKPMNVRLWKEEGGFRGSANRRAVVINQVIATAQQ